ncbi:hypothetical protein GCM10027169_25290 [Gordonia jinhuaensis]|uniref:HTH marR-type domain-containing protein n=1 Tax=Gordonia jinhuaensis TaxID=1517702 RepID=A0A916TCL9_9ACTN|nr:MarR family winged helix-turn-helix transcriptional regulator [Gordonia jinhuaensis]GGB39421.1 hypothetical protein GCM10011489_28890 [Gordonia jinhuaensis]
MTIDSAMTEPTTSASVTTEPATTGQVGTDQAARRESIELLVTGLRRYGMFRESMLTSRDHGKSPFPSGRGGDLAVEKSAYRCLFALDKRPARSGELAEYLHADPSTVSRHVAQLVDAGHVQREPDPRDGRASVLALTDNGREFVASLRAERAAFLDRILDDWETGDLESVAALFTRLMDRFEEHISGAPGGSPAASTPGRTGTGA